MQVPQLVPQTTLVVESDLETAGLDGRNSSGETVFTAVLEEDPTTLLPAMEFGDVASRSRSPKDTLFFAPQIQLEHDQQAVSKADFSGSEGIAVTLIEGGGANPIIRGQETQTADLLRIPNRSNPSLLGQPTFAPSVVQAASTTDRSQGALDEKTSNLPPPSVIPDGPLKDRNIALRSDTDVVSKNNERALAAEKPPMSGKVDDGAQKTLRNPSDFRSQPLAAANSLPLPSNQTELLSRVEKDAPFAVQARQFAEPRAPLQQVASPTEGHEGHKSARDYPLTPDNPPNSNAKEKWSTQKSFVVSQSTPNDPKAISKGDLLIDPQLPASGATPVYAAGKEEKARVVAQKSDSGVSTLRVGEVHSDPKAHTFSEITTKLPVLDRPNQRLFVQETVRLPRDVQTETHKPSNAMSGALSTMPVVDHPPQDLLSTKQLFVSEKTNFQSFDLPNGGPVLVGDVKFVADFKGVDLGSAKLEQPRAVMPQLTEAVRSASNGVIEVKLAPEELGRVKLSLTPTEAGLAVTIVAERAETIELIRRNIDFFANDLRQLGHQNLSFQFGHSGRQAGSSANPKEKDDLGDHLRTEQAETAAPPFSQTRMVHGQLDLRI